MNILIAHLHGGESSGSLDEAFRHAITKLAHIHLAATEKSKRKIIRLGEDSSRIFVVGAPGLDGIYKEIIDKREIMDKYGLNTKKPKILLIQHPVVTEVEEVEKQIRETLDAIVDLKYQTILIYPNADAGGRKMIEVIKEYTQKYKFIKPYANIPRNEYLSLINVVSVMVGNSSSGIIEAPYFKLPVVNIGTRQKMRERADNVIDVDYDREEIKRAVITALSKEFREKVKKCENPYYKEGTSERIVELLEKVSIKELLQK